VHSLLHMGVMAAVTWDPFIRGTLILLLFIVLLPGSIFFVLSTDTGIRLGFLLAMAGLTGMVCLLSTLWMPLASTADVGRPNTWKPLEIVTGDFAHQVTVAGAKSFPADNLRAVKAPRKKLPDKHWYWPVQSCSDSGWHTIDPSLISDPESEGDKVLAPSSSEGGKTPPALTTPFSSASDYVYVDGYTSGQDGGCLLSINQHKVYLPLARGAHYVILRVQPALPTLTLGGAPAPPQPDTSKAFTYVIMVRNLGSVRQPQALLAISSGIIFLVICYVLHTRDKAIEADAAEAAAAERDKAGAPA